MSGRERQRWLLLLGAGLAAVMCAAPFVGPERIGLGDIFAGDPARQFIFWQIRVPRVLLAVLAGAGLAVSGMAFQGLLRNPLATPFTLGVSSGAAFGAAAAIFAGAGATLLGYSSTMFFGFLGAVGVIFLVYGLTRLKPGFSTATMLLAGVATSLFFSSLILFLQYVSDFTQTFRMVRWLMGGVEALGYRNVLLLAPLVMGGGTVIFLLRMELNIFLTGEELAASRGVEVERTKRAIFITVSLLTGAIVATCGPIGFVGLIVPHLMRLLMGPDHQALTPASLLAGGLLLVICDTIARTLMAPAELPVGIIMALLGGPFFIYILITK